jgi:hypothetical protein
MIPCGASSSAMSRTNWSRAAFRARLHVDGSGYTRCSTQDAESQKVLTTRRMGR